MTVRKRGDHYFVDVVGMSPDGETIRVRKFSSVQTRRGAEQYERNIRMSIVNGTFSGRQERKEIEPIPSFKDFSELFIDTYAIPNNRPSEVRAKQGHLRCYLLPAFEKKAIDAISRRDIETLKGALLKKPLKAKTVNNVLTTLNRLLQYAVELEVIPHAPKVVKLKAEKPKFDCLTPEEASRLIEAAGYNPEWQAMIVMVLKTGLRYGELCELRWKDIDFSRNVVNVSRSYYVGHVHLPKSGKTRVVSLSPDLEAMLKSMRHLKSDLVFCKEDGGRHMHRRADYALKRCCKKAGLRPIGWHVLRHTFASHLVDTGVHLRTIQELLGHSTITMTERYAHTSTRLMQEAVTTLDRHVECTVTAPLRHQGNERLECLG